MEKHVNYTCHELYILLFIFLRLVDIYGDTKYNPVFDSLLSIKTAVDQYLWMLQRFCLLF